MSTLCRSPLTQNHPGPFRQTTDTQPLQQVESRMVILVSHIFNAGVQRGFTASDDYFNSQFLRHNQLLQRGADEANALAHLPPVISTIALPQNLDFSAGDLEESGQSAE
ncbi:MAG: hypothetical protein LR011_02190 [Verrucomicrobia bacterium]|nr:hypothetical protein [Verrucomicrobiota bacterium]